jgi:hypothetical protein
MDKTDRTGSMVPKKFSTTEMCAPIASTFGKLTAALEAGVCALGPRRRRQIIVVGKKPSY